MRSRDDSGDVAAAIVMLVVLVLTVLIIVFLKAIGVLQNGDDDEQEEEPPAPTRMFGAPADARWLAAYDYWLYHLERNTGIDFVASPSRMVMGAVIVSVIPAVMVGLPLDVIDPGAGMPWTLALGGVALVVGFITGTKLSRPVETWFGSGAAGGSSPVEREDVIVIGEEQ